MNTGTLDTNTRGSVVTVTIIVFIAVAGLLLLLLPSLGRPPSGIAYESSAMAALRQYHAAQHQYQQAGYGQCNQQDPGGFCPSFRFLGGEGAHKDFSKRPLELIPPKMAASSLQSLFKKYYFIDDPSIEDRKTEFGLYAIPGEQSDSTKRTLWIGTEGVIMAKDLKGEIPGTGFVRDETWYQP